MAHFFRLIPSQPHLYRVAIPFNLKLSEGIKDSTLVTLDTYDLNALFAQKTGIWGVNIRQRDESFFVGPRLISYAEGDHDFVMGLDDIDFIAIRSDLELPVEREELEILEHFDPLERNVLEKIVSTACFDFTPAVAEGTEFLRKHGLRTGGSTVNFYGKIVDASDESDYAMLLGVPNNRQMNPVYIKTLTAPSEEDLQVQLIREHANLSLLQKDYHNFYLSRGEFEPGIHMVGFFEVSLALVLYYAHTGVYLEGIRDHHPNAGCFSESKDITTLGYHEREKKAITLEGQLRQEDFHE